ncbi:MAG: hypothetical protein Kow00121_04470 [Elainellaceae cyanobacterium]
MESRESYPLVTIGIPTYNRANGYLKLALGSALAQTYPNLEIIVSDNCSTDNTQSLVESYADPRVKYVKQDPQVSANENFNACLNTANGEYFLLLHDDDLIDADFVETCMRQANYRTDYGVIRTGTRRIDANGNTISENKNRVGGLPVSEFFIGWFDKLTSVYLCSTLFNTRKLKEIGGFQSKTQVFQDAVALVKLASKYGRIDVVDVKASYRNHEAQNTHAVKVMAWVEDSMYLLDIMCELEKDNSARIRSKGSKFFSKLNYRRASVINSLVERWKINLFIYRLFNFHYSPLDDWYETEVLPRLHRVRFRIKSIMGAQLKY